MSEEQEQESPEKGTEEYALDALDEFKESEPIISVALLKNNRIGVFFTPEHSQDPKRWGRVLGDVARVVVDSLRKRHEPIFAKSEHDQPSETHYALRVVEGFILGLDNEQPISIATIPSKDEGDAPEV